MNDCITRNESSASLTNFRVGKVVTARFVSAWLAI